MPSTLPTAILIAAFTAAQPDGAKPPVVTPDPIPSDATVVFDGTNLDGLVMIDGSPCEWKLVRDGNAAAVEIVPGTGAVKTVATHGDAQIHIEFMTPTKEMDPAASGSQDDGNSGVYIQGRYEVQVLNSYQSETYPDGQCGAIYGQHAPLVNASRKPGEWQTFDITFRAAKFNDAGERTSPSRLTVLHNGVLIHDHAALKGVTGGNFLKETPQPGPICLQDHSHPVRYRNIWIRPLN